MNVVLDANIYISSIFWKGNPRRVLERAIKGIDHVYITDDILDEIRGVMGREKFHLENDEVEHNMKSIENITNKITPVIKIEGVCRDADDDKYLACATYCNAGYIISGDGDLLALKEYRDIRIVNAKEYLERMENRTPKIRR
jgi:putative PIN family toxin of toxin-antitoxin system